MPHSDQNGGGVRTLPMAIDSGRKTLDQSSWNDNADISQYNVTAQTSTEDGQPERLTSEENNRTIENVKKDLLALIPTSLALDAQKLFRELWELLRGEPGPENARSNTGTQHTTNDAIANTVRETIRECFKQQEEQPRRPWAQIADRAPVLGLPRHWEAPNSLKTTHQVTISLGMAAPNIKTREIADTVKAVNQSTQDEPVAAARRLPSGDVVLVLKNETAQQALLAKTDWLIACFGTTATIHRRTVSVIAKGIPTGHIPATDDELRRQLEGENKVTIAAARPLRRRPDPTSRTAIIIRLYDATEANKLCDRELILGSEVFRTEPYHAAARPQQCYNCHNFGHIAKFCKKDGVCGRCSNPVHPSGEKCPAEDEQGQVRCPLCGGPHPAWSKDCPRTQREWDTALQNYPYRPTRFQDSSPRPTEPEERPGRQRQEVNQQPERDTTRRGPGRPAGSTNRKRTQSQQPPDQRRLGFNPTNRPDPEQHQHRHQGDPTTSTHDS